MKSLNKEINKFIESISQEEKQKNPKLRKRIILLLKSIEKLNKSPQEIPSNYQGVLKFIDKTMLN